MPRLRVTRNSVTGAAVAATGGGAVAPLSWDAGQDLVANLAQTPTNPNGAWSYGYYIYDGFVLVTSSTSQGWTGPGQYGSPNFIKNSNDSTKIDSHTSIGYFSVPVVLRWTAPSKIVVNINATIAKDGSTQGNGIAPSVKFNGAQIASSSSINGSQVANFVLQIACNQGDTVDFVVGNNGDSSFDGFSYQASFTESSSSDWDSVRYINNIEAADGQSLESGVKTAINDFIVGCKADGTWSALKASCILAGARTLAGALVPLVGTAPTNFNFVSGDYNRKTGLVGNGSTKYLNSNRAGNADPQNSLHMSIYASTINTGTLWYAGSDNTATGATAFYSVNTNFIETKNRNPTNDFQEKANSAGFIGMSRASSTGYTIRSSGSDLSKTRTSQTPASANYGIFLSLGISPGAYGNGRYAFYSIGEAVDLALLDTRLTTLMSSLATAIP